VSDAPEAQAGGVVTDSTVVVRSVVLVNSAQTARRITHTFLVSRTPCPRMVA
jgi:hypothetical protein